MRFGYTGSPCPLCLQGDECVFFHQSGFSNGSGMLGQLNVSSLDLTYGLAVGIHEWRDLGRQRKPFFIYILYFHTRIDLANFF